LSYAPAAKKPQRSPHWNYLEPALRDCPDFAFCAPHPRPRRAV